MLQKNEIYTQNVLKINVMTKNDGVKKIFLKPQQTYRVINNKESYDIIRIFRISTEINDIVNINQKTSVSEMRPSVINPNFMQ